MKRLAMAAVLWMSVNAAFGECVATPCYVERVTVESCRPLSAVAVSADDLERAGLEPERAWAILEAAEGVIIRGRLESSRPFPQCGAPTRDRLADGPEIREYLVLNETCENLPLGSSPEGFVKTPCCDTLPVQDPECVISLEVLRPLPGEL